MASDSRDARRWAESLVADESHLWGHLLVELGKIADIQDVRPDGIRFTAQGETTQQLLMTSPSALREFFVKDQLRAIAVSEDQAYAVAHLPGWFIDELFELIGADEEPADRPVIELRAGTLIREGTSPSRQNDN